MNLKRQITMLSPVQNSVALILLLALLAINGNAAQPEIDPDWQRYKVALSFVDPKARLVVAGDRELSVPYNSPIFNSAGQAIAIANLHPGDRVWLYLDNSVIHKGPAQAKRIERIKQ